MPKRRKKPKWRRQVTQGIKSRQRLGPAEIPPEINEILVQVLGHPPTRADLDILESGLVHEVLKRMVEIRIAQWYGTVLSVLMEHFDFSQVQCTEFSQQFKRAWHEQTVKPQTKAG